MAKKVLWSLLILGALGCGGSASSSNLTKSFVASWTPQYSSLVGAWGMSTALFNEGSVFVADIGDNGTIKNSNSQGMASVSGPVSFALRFDGTDDRVEVPFRNNNNLNSFSVSLWLRLNGGSGDQSVISSREGPVGKGYSFYVNSSGQPEVRVGRGNIHDWGVATGVALLNYSWIHIAFTYDGTFLRLYQNGALQASTLTAYLPNTTQPLYIGAGGTELAPNAADFFSGDIDEVAIWSSVLDDSEVLTIYQRQKF